MNSETLSQNDIDRLLGGGTRAAPDGEVHVYDFRRPHRVSKEHLRTLEAMYERLVKSLEAWLVSRVRGQVEVRLQSVEQFSFREFTLSLPTPCSSFVFEIAGSGQRGVLDVGPEFSYYIIDRLFGGEGGGAPPLRALTPIERMAVRSIADRVAALLQEIWQDHVPMELNITAFESSPEILQVVNRDDPVLVASVEVVAGGATSVLLICLPFSVLDKFFTSSGHQRIALLTTNDVEREQTRQRSEAALRVTSVPLTARLPEFQLSMRDIARLDVGSIIPTGIPKDSKVIIRAGTQERFVGYAGRLNGNVAVRVLDSVQAAPPAPEARSTHS